MPGDALHDLDDVRDGPRVAEGGQGLDRPLAHPPVGVAMRRAHEQRRWRSGSLRRASTSTREAPHHVGGVGDELRRGAG